MDESVKHGHVEASPLTSMLRRWWKGEERLVKVYWPSIGILIALGVAGLGTPYLPGNSPVILWSAQFIVAGFCLCSIWACSFNVRHRIWGYLARIHAGFGAIGLVGSMLKAFQSLPG
jgi:hypothetical protein